MKEIPVTLVKANQIMLVALTLFAIIFQSTILVGITFVIIASSLIFGPKGNLAFRITKALSKKDFSKDDTEAVVLQRFNQTIAGSLITVALIVLISTGHVVAWLFVGMVTLAASIALMGFCIGCVLYYQFKKLSYKLNQ